MTKGRFAKLGSRAPAATPDAPPAPALTGRTKGGRAPSREGKVAIAVWVKEETRHQLHKLALDEKTSLEALVLEALDMLARSRALHPFGERKPRR